MGWWITPLGKWKQIPDHFEYVRAHPKEFGIQAKETKDWGLSDRSAVLESVLRKGFIRVRGTRPHLSMEFWALDGDTIANINDFLVGNKIDPGERVMFESRIGARYEPASWILEGRALSAAANPHRKRRKVKA